MQAWRGYSLPSPAVLGVPRAVRRVLGQVPRVVRLSIAPPDRTPLTQGRLGGMHGRSGRTYCAGILCTHRAFHRPSSVHQFLHQAIPLGLAQGWVGCAPEPAAYHQIAPIRRAKGRFGHPVLPSARSYRGVSTSSSSGTLKGLLSSNVPDGRSVIWSLGWPDTTHTVVRGFRRLACRTTDAPVEPGML
jgi:hypothetical protein